MCFKKLEAVLMKHLIRSIIVLARKCETLDELIKELYYILDEKEEATQSHKRK